MKTFRLAILWAAASMCGWSGEASETIGPAGNPARGFTGVVARRGDHVVVSDSDGRIVIEKKAGQEDAQLIQEAAEMCRSGGELRIMAGQYDLEKSIVLDFPCMVSGEGRDTVLVPPANDYALRIMKTDRSPTINIFVHNMLGSQGRIRLQDAQTAVVTGNRFGRVEQEAIVLVPQSLLQANHRIQVSENVFAAAP